MAFTMIYIHLQSIYNDLHSFTTQLQSTTMVFTMIYNDIYNNLQPIITQLQ